MEPPRNEIIFKGPIHEQHSAEREQLIAGFGQEQYIQEADMPAGKQIGEKNPPSL